MKRLRGARKTDAEREAPAGTTAPLAVDDELVASVLEDLEAGLTPLQILDRHRDRETELAPLIEAAYVLRTTRWPTMSMAGRVAGRERLHVALASQKPRSAGFLPPLWRQLGVSLALVLMAGAAFLASPYSPLDLRRNSGVTTATPFAVAPVLAAPSATATLTLLPTATATPSATATVRAATRPARTAEPSETPERALATAVLRTAEPSPTATRTRRPAVTRTATTPATATAVAGATPVPAQDDAPTAIPPSPTPVTPTVTATRAKPSPTATLRPTRPPEPTEAPTALPTATPTARPTAPRLPSPTATRPASPTPEPSETPAPSETPRPRRTPRASETPQNTATVENDSRPRLPELARDAAGRAARERADELRALRTPRPLNRAPRRP